MKIVTVFLIAIVLSACSKQKDDFTITYAAGADTNQAIPLFRKLVDHCPGIYKYKDDVDRVEYGAGGGYTNFRIIIKAKPSVMPLDSSPMGHTCHFQVDESKATVSKRPCAWLCTGQDMTGTDGDDHSYANGMRIN